MNRAAEQAVANIEYEELEIEVGRCLCGKGEVRILSSRFDRPREPFQPSYKADELNRCLEELDKLFLVQGQEVISKRRQLAESIGQDLYRALLPGKVQQTFNMSLASMRTVRNERKVGLRLRLSFGEASRYLPEVVGLPWELLCSPGTQEFPSSAPETPLVRYLDLERPIEAVKVTPPIRVLAVLASPRGLRAIDREQHENILRGAAGRKGHLELTILRQPTLSALREQLQTHKEQREPIHVIHFLGHGAFDVDGRGYLNFEHQDGSPDRVLGRDLARTLAGFQEVRLAVLSTCVGARMMRRQGQHPFAGSASALVAGGLPAVVGMQFPLSEAAASAFTRSFYGHLADGRPLEEAVTEGRLRILTADASTFEWASPVLFLRARDGKVLDLASDSEKRQLPAAGGISAENVNLAGGNINQASKGDINQAGGNINRADGSIYQAGRDINTGSRPRRG